MVGRLKSDLRLVVIASFCNSTEDAILLMPRGQFLVGYSLMSRIIYALHVKPHKVSLSYYFKFDRSLLNFYNSGHLVMPIIRSMHVPVIGMQSWTYISENITGKSFLGHPCQKKKTDLILFKIVHLTTRTTSFSPSFSKFQLCHTAPTQIIFSPLPPFNKAS